MSLSVSQVAVVVLLVYVWGAEGSGQMNSLPRSFVVNADHIFITAANPDTTPPILTNFTVHSPPQPTTFNAISFTVAMNDGTGIGAAGFFVHVYSGSQRIVSTGDMTSCQGCGINQALYYGRCDCTEGSTSPVGAPWLIGEQRTASLSLSYALNGTYELVVQVTDRMGNINNYYGSDLQLLGFQSKISIWSSTVVDTTAPQLDAITFNPYSLQWNPQVNNNYQLPLHVLVNVSDNADVYTYTFAFRPQQLNPVMEGFALMSTTSAVEPLATLKAASLLSPDPVNPLPAFPSGQYDLSVVVTDYQQNKAYYSASDITQLGFSSTALLTNGSPDHVAPTCTYLASLVATPSSEGPSIISFDGAEYCADDDAGVGLGGYNVIIQGPGPFPMQYTVSGQPGVPAQLHMYLDNSLPGLYQVVGLVVWDMVGNVRGYGSCASWQINMYQQTPGLQQFDPTICDLDFPSESESIVHFGWVAAICITGVLFFCVLILSINQCHRDGCCDCCCSCCACCYKKNYSDKLEAMHLSLGPP